MPDVDALVAVVVDSDRRLRERTGAIKELGRLGDSRAVSPLREALLGDDSRMSAGAAVALGNLGAADAVPALIQVLGTHEDKNVRMLTAQALGKIGDPVAADALRKASSDRVEAVRTTARTALKKMERAAAAKVRENPEDVGGELRTLADDRLKRRAFNLPFILLGLAAAGGASYWVGGSDSLQTALPVLIGAAVLVVAANLAQGWWMKRKG